MQDVLSKTNGSRNSNGCATKKKLHFVMYVKNILGLLTVTLDYYKVFEDLSKWIHLSFMRHPVLTKKCCVIDLARNHPENTRIAVCQRKMDSKMFKHLKCLFNTAYYIAKLNKPLTDFRNLIALLNKHDVDRGPD
jgi:hypothetical protein